MRHYLGVVVLAVALVGCGSTDDAPSPNPQPAPTSVAEQDPGALRLEMNILSSPEDWYHDISDVYIDGDTVVIKVGHHEGHEPASAEETLKMCENAFAAAKKANVRFSDVTVSLADKVVAGVDQSKGETACRTTA
ncbi:MAG: hypothetical protein M3548_00235 [Actinomycetota bacterium]|nr:hypothetical protein [Actinomycetota bacterium]